MHPAHGRATGRTPRWTSARSSATRSRASRSRTSTQDATGATLQINAPRDAVPPSASTGLTATATGTSATLQWTAASDDYAVDHYVVDARRRRRSARPRAPTFTDTGLVPGTKVAYTVAAVDVGGNVGPAASASVTIPDTTAPSAPGKVTAKLTKDGKVHLAWTAATDNGQRRELPRAARRQRDRVGQRRSRTSTRHRSRAAARRVTYSVVAVDLAGNVGPAAQGDAAARRAAAQAHGDRASTAIRGDGRARARSCASRARSPIR